MTDPRIDTALARLDGLGEMPPVEHVEVYEVVHRVLQDVLAETADSTPDSTPDIGHSAP